MNSKTVPITSKLPIILFFLVLLSYVVLLLPQEQYIRLTAEDSIFENLTALFFLFTAIVFFLLFANKRYFKSESLRTVYAQPGNRYAFLVFSLIFFFGFAEEISWGQRLIGFATPESMLVVNAKQEFNIHNLAIFNGDNGEGLAKSGWQRLFTMKKLFLYFFFGYLFVLPLLYKNSEQIRELLRRWMIPVPQLWLGVLFLENFLFYGILRICLEGQLSEIAIHGLNEIEEFNFSLVLLGIPSVWFAIPKKSQIE